MAWRRNQAAKTGIVKKSVMSISNKRGKQQHRKISAPGSI